MNFLRKLLHVEPEVIRVEVPKYIQVRSCSQEITGILSDMKWCKIAIKSRIDHPELYKDTEDVSEVIQQSQDQIRKLQDRLVSAL